MNQCIVCGEKYDGDDHHCDPKWEAKIERGRKSHTEKGIERVNGSFATQLAAGFAIMQAAYR